jgi:hypothetical protein
MVSGPSEVARFTKKPLTKGVNPTLDADEFNVHAVNGMVLAARIWTPTPTGCNGGLSIRTSGVVPHSVDMPMASVTIAVPNPLITMDPTTGLRLTARAELTKIAEVSPVKSMVTAAFVNGVRPTTPVALPLNWYVTDDARLVEPYVATKNRADKR